MFVNVWSQYLLPCVCFQIPPQRVTLMQVRNTKGVQQQTNKKEKDTPHHHHHHPVIHPSLILPLFYLPHIFLYISPSVSSISLSFWNLGTFCDKGSSIMFLLPFHFWFFFSIPFLIFFFLPIFLFTPQLPFSFYLFIFLSCWYLGTFSLRYRFFCYHLCGVRCLWTDVMFL